MNKLEIQKKKRRIINLCLVGLCILIVAGVVLVDQIQNRQTTATMTPESAQAQLDALLESLPTSVAKVSKHVVANTKTEVISVEEGDAREFVVKVKYETLNVAAMYEANKDAIFQKAWEYAEGVKADGKKVNATKLQSEVQKFILAQLESGDWRISGEAEVYFYDVRAEEPVMYIADETLNSLLGGFVSVKDDIKNTTEIVVGGETISIASDNTFRNGINQCFGLDNYDAQRPDTSSPLTQKWNSVKADFHKNFIEKNRWLYILEGIGNTLALT